MERSTQENGAMEYGTVLDFGLLKMESRLIQANGQMGKLLDTDSTIKRISIYIKGNLQILLKMVQEWRYFQMETDIKEIIKKDNPMGKENIDGNVVQNMKVNLKMVQELGRAA